MTSALYAGLRRTLADRYDVEREIGAGGMATVFLARDLRHHRRVALKVLNPELGAVLGVERFLSEIRVTANLQHPNLLPLFDSGEADGLLFYVMPFVEGESLRARLDREKQLPIDDALRIATAVGSALDYAHRHGVIHRDLKPENILMHEGQPLVADFGIALAVSNAGGNRITQTGLSLGTPHYMSPEQATGDRVIDGRTDIYSLGAVLYEMLTGEPPHTGSTAQAVIARVLTEKPRHVRATRESVPPHVEIAIERALAKLPADRQATAHDFVEALGGKREAGSDFTAAALARDASRVPRFASRAVLATLLVAAVILGAWGWLRGRDDEPVVRFTMALPRQLTIQNADRPSLAISPDGKMLAFYATNTGGSAEIWVRPMDQLEPRVLAGTTGARMPIFSPDGRWIAFWSSNQLRKVSVDGGPVMTVAEFPGNISGISWGVQETIIVGTANNLVAVPSTGGPQRLIWKADGTNDPLPRWPLALSDGNTVLYTAWAGSAANSRIGIVTIDNGQHQTLDLPGTFPIAIADAKLVYAGPNGTVRAVPFDVRRHRVTGSPVQVVENVVAEPRGSAQVSVSKSGSLVYLSGQAATQLVSVDAANNAKPVLDEVRAYLNPRYSPDGKRLALTIIGSQGTDVWVYELSTGTLSRRTTEGLNERAEWTPDSKRLVYRSDRDGSAALWWQPADGSGVAERIAKIDDDPYEGIISPDGKLLMYRTGPTAKSMRDIFYLSLTGDRTPKLFVGGPFAEQMPRFSPDGRYVAYQSNESGKVEVYVRPFPGPGAPYQVSVDGGIEPLWSRDGRKLFYRTESGVFVASVTTLPTFAVLKREPFLMGSYEINPSHPNYDVAPDGAHLLMIKRAGEEPQIVVVHNWLRDLRARTSAAGSPP